MRHQQPILAEVEAFMAATGMTPTAFGKKTLRDPRLVHGLRNGRRLWPDTEAKVRDFIERNSPCESEAN